MEAENSPAWSAEFSISYESRIQLLLNINFINKYPIIIWSE